MISGHCCLGRQLVGERVQRVSFNTVTRETRLGSKYQVYKFSSSLRAANGYASAGACVGLRACVHACACMRAGARVVCMCVRLIDWVCAQGWGSVGRVPESVRLFARICAYACARLHAWTSVDVCQWSTTRGKRSGELIAPPSSTMRK